ncbi:type VII secretion protein EccB [Dietzia psychralcaliphila]|uniref:Type VII secretion protein EccB n=2 Tax=Dietzia psychralcaliphila TaxID=139021 RepID=A0AAD0JQQ8_9ACTN|nr:type VII secretion protein EccB [Dietzia psychralcaliphila]AWH96140.1 type VII secretion protein EccB [Dietzia psychralcaliphila]PTM90799.1 type VII secretion protein EccB [Dietzia psychralcaliphila]
MPLKPTTKAQVDGHRFLSRRARHAVVARDVRMLHDPLRRQSTGLMVGAVAAVLGCAGAAVLALLDPTPDVDRAVLMVGRDSGQMYVRAGDTVHPVFNLASARLVTGQPAEPTTVRDSDIAGTRRGGLLGIPGAPSALPAHRDAGGAAAVSWTVCDEVADADRGRPRIISTSVVAREGAAGPGRDTAGDEVVLADQDGRGWLLRDGTRSRIDLSDGDLLAILGLGGVAPRPVTAALIDPLPEVDPVVRPEIEMAGRPVDYGLDSLRIGQIFTVDTASGTGTYVALADGVQEVGPVVADVIRSTSTVGAVVSVDPDRMGVPRSMALDVDAFPADRPSVLSTGDSPVLCVRDSAREGTMARRVTVVAGAPAPPAAEARPLAGADGGGPAVDAVGIPGGGLLVAAVGRGTSTRGAVTTIVTDTGVRFDVPDPETAAVLGVGGTPVPVDGAIIDRLPAGPRLDRDSALVSRDGSDLQPVADGDRAPVG